MGIAGPLAGFVVTLPVLIFGLYGASFVPDTDAQGGLMLGDPLLLQWLARLFLGPTPEGMTLTLGPMGLAGWFGLFLTGLNLLPIGQLDGGHVTYALLGKRASFVSRLGFFACVALIYFGPNWLIWSVLLLLLGRGHPRTMDDHQPVGDGRTVVGLLGLVVFIVCFVPDPIVGSWQMIWRAHQTPLTGDFPALHEVGRATGPPPRPRYAHGMNVTAAVACAILLVPSWARAQTLGSARVDGDGIRLEFDGRMKSRVVATFAGETPLGPFEDSETLLTAAGALGDFTLESRDEAPVKDAIGEGRRVTLTGHAGRLAKRVEVTAYPARPRFLFLRVRYTNEGDAPVETLGWTSHLYGFTPSPGQKEPAFWSYQSGSYEKRPDWVLPLPAAFTQQNFLGMNDSDYGGGTPVLDVWRRDVGLAVGHVELLPKLVSLPVRRRRDGSAELAVSAKRPTRLKPGDSLDTLRTFVAVHRGDHFETLRAYSETMQAQGVSLPQAPKDAFEPIWCAWGYGRDFTPRQVFDTLPVAQRLGLPVGGPRRRLAGGRRRLGARADQVPRRRRRHEGARGPHPRGRPQGPALVGAHGRRSRLAHRPRAPGLAAAQRGRLAAQDHLVGLELPVPGPRRGARGRGCVREEGARRVGLRRPQDRRPAPERGASLLQPGPRPRCARGRRRGSARATSRRSGTRPRPPSPARSSSSAPAAPRYSFFNLPYVNMVVASDP